jgi:hypothetical protein
VYQDDGGELIEHAMPHSLRRSFISLLLAAGADVPYVMASWPHSRPSLFGAVPLLR